MATHLHSLLAPAVRRAVVSAQTRAVAITSAPGGSVSLPQHTVIQVLASGPIFTGLSTVYRYVVA